MGVLSRRCQTQDELILLGTRVAVIENFRVALDLEAHGLIEYISKCYSTVTTSTSSSRQQRVPPPLFMRPPGAHCHPIQTGKLSIITGPTGACCMSLAKLLVKPAGHWSFLDLLALVIALSNCRCQSGRGHTVVDISQSN